MRLFDKVARVSAIHKMRRLVVHWWDGLEKPQYVVEIAVPETTDLSTLKVQASRGLLAVYTVNKPSKGDLRLISHSETVTTYQAAQKAFFGKLGLPTTAGPTAEGYQQQATTRPSTLGWVWRHAGLVIGFIGVTAGIVGNVEKIRDPVLALLLAPTVQITGTRARPRMFLPGRSLIPNRARAIYRPQIRSDPVAGLCHPRLNANVPQPILQRRNPARAWYGPIMLRQGLRIWILQLATTCGPC